MSDICHICGLVKHDAPTVICAPCALTGAGHESVLDELLELRTMRAELQRFRDGRWLALWIGESLYPKAIRRHIDDILALAPPRPA